jgi:hypothetical protein
MPDDPQSPNENEPRPPCPRCEAALRAADVAPHGLLGCVACGGVFLSHGAVRAVLDGSEGHATLETFAARLAHVVPTPPPHREPVACAVCTAPMTRVAIHGGAITAFTCNAHGSWFNAGDIARMRVPAAAPVVRVVPQPPSPPAAHPRLEDLPGVLPKPTSLLVIAWVWILFGGGWCFMATAGLLQACALNDDLEARPELSAQAHGLMGMVTGVFALVMVCALASAASGVACGVGLLRLRDWGRRGLVILTSLLLVYFVGFFAVYMWSALPALEQGFVVFHVAGAFGLVVFAGPTWLMLRHLRGPIIRQATEHASYFGRRAENLA